MAPVFETIRGVTPRFSLRAGLAYVDLEPETIKGRPTRIEAAHGDLRNVKLRLKRPPKRVERGGFR